MEPGYLRFTETLGDVTGLEAIESIDGCQPSTSQGEMEG